MRETRILLIEDAPNAADSVKPGLEAERYAVDIARGGEQVLRLATALPYDLIIVDLSLSGRESNAVLQRVRSMDDRVPILILAERDTIADKVSSFEAGANDYVTKPFVFAELHARVKALLRRGR